MELNIIHHVVKELGTSVSWLLVYGLHDSRIGVQFLAGVEIATTPTPDLRPSHHPIQWVRGAYPTTGTVTEE
jgi:hypothetical protein